MTKLNVEDAARKEAKKTALAMGRKEAAAKREAKKQAIESAKDEATRTKHAIEAAQKKEAETKMAERDPEAAPLHPNVLRNIYSILLADVTRRSEVQV
jgi:hypothetical protein